ncbi:MAG TPA: MlaD family protein [Thermoleophilaceae bacterium]|jgi:ABC-type transporter Mla subunit MlaD
MSPFRAGVLALVVLAVVSYFGFTKANPFSNPYELHAVFRDARNLQTRSPVRIAGVDVGRVTKVEPAGDTGAAKVTMQLRDDALPLHSDARLQVRPRILLEGNFFVDLQPGSPSADTLDDGATVKIGQTSTAVSLPEILSVLESDVRFDLQTALHEYGTEALGHGGAEALNRAIPYFAPAYRYTALTNDALLGERPATDVPRLMRGQARTFAALSANPEELKDLVTDLNTVAGALARQDSALEASVPALRDTLRAADPALARLNGALPTLRVFAREALPGVRSSVATLDAAIPWIRQARGLVQEDELQGLAADLRQAVPSLVQLNQRLVPLLKQARALSSCTNHVLVPFAESGIPSIESGNSGQEARRQFMRAFVGLAGESRVADANTPVFHVQAVSPVNLGIGRIEPGPPPNPNTPPQHRPDVPCETQDPPNLQAPSGPASAFGISGGAAAANTASMRRRLESAIRKAARR